MIPQQAVEDDASSMHGWFANGARACRSAWTAAMTMCLIAGLKEWYNTDQPVKPPLMNSIKVYTADKMMPLKKEYDFSFIGLLVSEDKADRPGGSHSVDELFALARTIFDKAMTVRL